METTDKSTLLELLGNRGSECRKGKELAYHFMCDIFSDCPLIKVVNEVHGEVLIEANKAIEKMKKSQTSQDYSFETGV